MKLQAYRKSGTQDLSWDPRPKTLKWDPKLGTYGGTLRWGPKVGP